MSDVVRWGVLSTAAISTQALIPGLLAAEGSELVGIASRSEERAAAAAARWGCRGYASYDELLDDAEIDAVYVPLPNHLHAVWTVRALEAGKHVLCEKPLAISVREVDAIAEASRRTGCIVLEAFMYRHGRRWQRAVQLVSTGALGEPRVVRIGFSFVTPTDLGSPLFDPDLGGGIIWDMGCCAASMARGILAGEPIDIFGFADRREGQPTETSLSGVMRFPHARTAPFWVSFDLPNPFAQVEVVGTDGWLLLPGTGMRREPYTKLLLHRGGTEIFLDGREPDLEVFPFEDPFRLEVERFADAVRGRAPLPWDLTDSRANTAVLEAMHASVQSNLASKVPVASTDAGRRQIPRRPAG
jgi:predicted dehydrogenase